MKPMVKSTCITTVLLSSLLLLSFGCSKKNVIPPEGTALGNTELSSGTGLTDGTAINYPEADAFWETGLAGEESIDSTGNGIGGLSINSGADQQSEEYRRINGRSSTDFRPIYFDFDQAGISPDMVPVLSANAGFMKDNPGILIIVEGNCDERGTNEYNLALGERRAINAKEYMVNLGVNPARIRTVSYGEERPLFIGHTELKWSQNRRADFITE